MVPMGYGEVIAMRLREQRREAARIRLARAAALPRPPARVWLAALMVGLANRVGGCDFAAEVVRPVQASLAG